MLPICVPTMNDFK